MTKPKWIWEVLMEDFPDWFGSQLYYDLAYGKFCSESDYKETIVSAQDKSMTWQCITKGMYYMYIDGEFSGMSMILRRVYDKGY